MSLPDTLNPTVPPDVGGLISLGPSQIRAIAQYIADVFGCPVSPTATTGQALSITAAGVVTIIQPGATVAANPTTNLGIATKQYVDAANASAALPYASITNGGSGNAYTGTLSPAIASYVVGALYVVVPVQTNTGAVTLNLNGLGALNVKVQTSSGTAAALTSGQLALNNPYILEYDGTQLLITNQAASSIGGGFATVGMASNVNLTSTPAMIMSLAATAPTGSATYRAIVSMGFSVVPSGGSPVLTTRISDGTNNIAGPGYIFTTGATAALSAQVVWPVTTSAGGSITFTLAGVTSSASTAIADKTGIAPFSLPSFMNVVFIPST